MMVVMMSVVMMAVGESGVIMKPGDDGSRS